MITPHLVRKHLSRFISNHISISTVCNTSRVSISNLPLLSLHFYSSSSSAKQLTTVPTIFDFLLNKHNFSPESATHIASIYPRLKNPENADSVLKFLKETGFSITQLEKIVRHRPRFLSARVDVSIKPKIKIFQDLGFSPDDICSIISNDPSILYLSAIKNITPSLSVLKDLLGSNYEIAKLLKQSAWLLTSNLETTMVPNFEFLKSIGVPSERIFLLLRSNPRIFLQKPENLMRSAEKAEEMGVDRSSKVFIYAVRAISLTGYDAWERKLQCFRDIGFSEDEIVAMFMKAPCSVAASTVKIKKITEVLLETKKFTLSCIVKYPVCFSYSVEKRFKPRIRILEILESRNLIADWPGLGELYASTDNKFFQKFVKPYPDEFSDVSVIRSSVRGKKGMKY